MIRGVCRKFLWHSRQEEEKGQEEKTVSNRAVVRIIASAKNRIEGEAVQQLEQVAQLQRMHTVIGLPDLHPGKGGPIGGAFFVKVSCILI